MPYGASSEGCLYHSLDRRTSLFTSEKMGQHQTPQRHPQVVLEGERDGVRARHIVRRDHGACEKIVIDDRA